jgi:hypothetical protein
MREIIRTEGEVTDAETQDWKKAIKETENKKRVLEDQPPAVPVPQPAQSNQSVRNC